LTGHPQLHNLQFMESITTTESRELALALSRYNALVRRPRSADAWAAISLRLRAALRPLTGDRRTFVSDRMIDADQRRELGRITGRPC